MINKRNVRLYIKFVILILCFIIVVQIYTLTLSKYESSSSSNANIDIAFYVLNTDFQSMTLNLGKIVPRKEPYVYRFTVSNEKEDKIAQTDIEYDLNIKTTTNLPLDYKLYLNEDYQNENASTIETDDIVEKDKDGTYFRTIKTKKQIFKHSVQGINTYTLVVYFPESYNSNQYQDILEVVEIKIDAKQIVEES